MHRMKDLIVPFISRQRIGVILPERGTEHSESQSHYNTDLCDQSAPHSQDQSTSISPNQGNLFLIQIKNEEYHSDISGYSPVSSQREYTPSGHVTARHPGALETQLSSAPPAEQDTAPATNTQVDADIRATKSVLAPTPQEPSETLILQRTRRQPLQSATSRSSASEDSVSVAITRIPNHQKNGVILGIHFDRCPRIQVSWLLLRRRVLLDQRYLVPGLSVRKRRRPRGIVDSIGGQGGVDRHLSAAVMAYSLASKSYLA